MFKNQTFENIMNRMLARVPNNLDKREGAIIYDALAPAAAELAQTYLQLDVVLNETFADVASRENLIKRAHERGINPYSATNAILKGEFKGQQGQYMDIPLNSRFSLGELNYTAIKKIQTGMYEIMCETKGTVGNHLLGNIIPIEYIGGLVTAELTEILVPGENEEDTEHLRERYFNSFESQAYGGNIADYREKVNAIAGVGGVKVYPVWNGGGTVKLVIIDSDFNKPSPTLIDQVQTEIDPVQNQGDGLGLAPIGHIVTVEGVTEATVNVESNIMLQDGYTWVAVGPNVVATLNDYLADLRKDWADNDYLIVRTSYIDTRILNVTGVLDVQDTKINGAAQNLALANTELPVLGEVIPT